MPDLNDVRRIALALPESREEEGRQFGVAVLNKGKWRGFVWAWNERVHPKKPKIPSETVVAVRVASLEEKEALLQSGHEALFTEPHYNGYPAVLIRLPLIEDAELEELIVDAWGCMAPKALVEAFRGS
jgi:hypothetical protein